MTTMPEFFRVKHDTTIILELLNQLNENLHVQLDERLVQEIQSPRRLLNAMVIPAQFFSDAGNYEDLLEEAYKTAR